MLPDCTKFVIFLYVEAQKYTFKKRGKIMKWIVQLLSFHPLHPYLYFQMI